MSWLSRLRSSLGRAREVSSAVARLGRPAAPADSRVLGRARRDADRRRFRRARRPQKIRHWAADRREAGRVEDHRPGRRALSQRRRTLSHAAGRRTAARSQRRPSCSSSASTAAARRRRSASSRRALHQRVSACSSLPATRFGPPPPSSWRFGRSAAAPAIVRGAEGADPASVVFDGVRAAKARGVDVVLVDTAGRLQTEDQSDGRAQEDPTRDRARARRAAGRDAAGRRRNERPECHLPSEAFQRHDRS